MDVMYIKRAEGEGCGHNRTTPLGGTYVCNRAPHDDEHGHAVLTTDYIKAHSWSGDDDLIVHTPYNDLDPDGMNWKFGGMGPTP